MVSPTTAYLLEQQRLAFKHNWVSEFNNWKQDWGCGVCEDLYQLNSVYELERYLYSKIDENSYTDEEYIYHNFINQTTEDKVYMFDYIMTQIAEMLEDERLYANGEL
jgi:hypothetical protein